MRYDTAPAVLVIADSERATAHASALVRRFDGRPLVVSDLAAGLQRLADAADAAVAIVAVERDAGPALDLVMDRLEADARDAARPSLVLLPRTLIDVAAARTAHPAVQLLVDAGEEEQIAAFGAALAASRRPVAMLREGGGGPVQLLQLSEEVGRIARTLAALSGANERRGPGPILAASGEARPPSAATVRALIRARRLREQFFEPALFADPAWDMMLDLYAARLEGRPVAVSSLCIAAAVPPTTALRWMKQLVDDGLLVRVADPRDGRRVFIELSPPAADALAGYFETLARIGFALP